MVLGRVVPWVAVVAVTVAVPISVAAVVASTSFPGFSTSIVKPHFIWTSCYYGQFALSLGKESSYFSLNSTRIIRTPH